MDKYHKIQTVFKRDQNNRNKTLLDGEFSLPEFEYLKDNEWVFTEKVDGTNIRIKWDGESLSLGGKTDNAQIPTGIVEFFNTMILPQKQLFGEIFDCPVCLYGEGYGPKIQSGGNYRKDQSIVIFDIKIGDFWLFRDDVHEISMKLGLDTVPIIGSGTLLTMVDIVREGFLSIWGNFIAEGIVARPAVEIKTRRGDRIITKIKYKDFVH